MVMTPEFENEVGHAPLFQKLINIDQRLSMLVPSPPSSASTGD
jgi:hypothetical protein